MKTQIEENLEQLIESVEENKSEIIESLENYSNDKEEIEDLLYNNNVEEIAEILDLTIILEAFRYGLRDL